MIKSKFKKWYAIPFLILLVILIYVHYKININFGDDLYFKNVLNNNTLYEFLDTRYYTWSSRVIIEAIMVIILKFDPIVWKVLDIGICFILAYSINKIFNENVKEKEKYTFILVMLMLLYPFKEMSSAGWIATTNNYLWPLSIGMFSLLLPIKLLRKEKLKKIEILFYLFATIYSCNIEQGIVVFVPTYIILIIFNYIKHKKINICLIIQLIIGILSALFIFSAPGNYVRKLSEVASWYPNYEMLNFIEKVKLSLTSTVAPLISPWNSINILMIMFTILILVAVWVKCKVKLYRVISLIPFTLCIFLGPLRIITYTIFPNLRDVMFNFNNGMIDFTEITAANYTAIISYIPIFLTIIFIGFIFISIYIIFGNTIDSLICLYIFAIGLISRLAMGFSPTVYASGLRTFIFLYFCIILIMLQIIKIINKYVNKTQFNVILSILVVSSVLSVINYW